ncbi:flagellar basal body rod C-terminal domain-containing protein [Shigella flexneri]
MRWQLPTSIPGKNWSRRIVAQRNYQSNAQTIKTQDQILNTLVNLR